MNSDLIREALKKALLKQGAPVRVTKSLSFYPEEKIKDLWRKGTDYNLGANRFQKLMQRYRKKGTIGKAKKVGGKALRGSLLAGGTLAAATAPVLGYKMLASNKKKK